MAFCYCRGSIVAPKLDDGLAMVQLAVILILKRLRRRGHSFKSHPTDWEKPGIVPGPPNLQGIGYRRRNALVFCRVPWLLPVQGWFLVFQDHPMLKCQWFWTGPWLYASSNRLGGEAGNRTCHPWLTRHRLKNVLSLSLCSNQ